MAAAYLAQNIVLPLSVHAAGTTVQPSVFMFDTGLFPGGEIPTTWVATFDLLSLHNDDGTVHSASARGSFARASNGTITVDDTVTAADEDEFTVEIAGGTDQVTVSYSMPNPSTAAVTTTLRLRFLSAPET